MRHVLVNDAGGFIGGDMVNRLKAENCWVRAVRPLLRWQTSSSSAIDAIGDRRLMRARPSANATIPPRTPILPAGRSIGSS
jgi:nucleoside-diphosphate-sugar epimerase